jgi:hypothetical protein
VADPRTSSVAVTASKDMMEQIASMVEQLDQDSPRVPARERRSSGECRSAAGGAGIARHVPEQPELAEQPDTDRVRCRIEFNRMPAPRPPARDWEARAWDRRAADSEELRFERERVIARNL